MQFFFFLNEKFKIYAQLSAYFDDFNRIKYMIPHILYVLVKSSF